MAYGWRSAIHAVPLLALAGGTLPAAAQTGTLAGRVSGSDGHPPGSARIQLLLPNGAVVAGAHAAGDGRYRISAIAPGTYLVRVSAIGYAAAEFPGTVIRPGAATPLDAVLESRPVRLEELSVTAVSRGLESLRQAPAAAFAVARTEVEERPVLTVVEHLRRFPGADISQGGLVQANVVARGFNNIFSGALLMLVDERTAAVPALRVNVPSFFPVGSDDIERVEFVLGPGSAVHGPNAANGVLHVVTRSPFNSTGSTLTLETGLRAASTERICRDARCGDPDFRPLGDPAGLFRLSGRHAMRLGNRMAVKLSGNYLRGTEWRARDPNEPTDLTATHPELGLPADRCTPLGCRDFRVEQWGGELRLDARPDSVSELIGAFGYSNSASLIEYTGLGAVQSRGWSYRSAQLRFRRRRLQLNGFANFSGAGLDQGSVPPHPRAWLLRSGLGLADLSRVWSLQASHGGTWFGRMTAGYGADYLLTEPRTQGTVNGLNEADDNIHQIGGWLNTVTRLGGRLDLVATLRADHHSRLAGAILSPRAGLLFRPGPEQTLRLTFNRAFSTPANLDLFLDIAAGRYPVSAEVGYAVRALGVPATGFAFRGGDCGGGLDGLCMRTAFDPAAGLLPAAAAPHWVRAVEARRETIDPALVPLLLANPPSAAVGTQLRLLSTARLPAFHDIVPADVQDIARLRPTRNYVIELGYNALLGRRVQLSASAWFENKRDFIGPLVVESPSVFLEPASTVAYLTQLFTQAGVADPETSAREVGAVLAGESGNFATPGVPLGTVVPVNTPLTARPDLFLSFRNFGTVNLWGGDLAFDYQITRQLALSGAGSWVSRDFFPAADVGRPTPVALNASRLKGSLTLAWRDDPRGWGLELGGRAIRGFPVTSGVYESDPDPENPGRLLPTDSYALLDLQATWRPPLRGRPLLLSLGVSNLLNRHYRTFVGLPNLGRIVLTRVRYTL